jgi:SAM-dependent methyltransferase
MPAPVQWEDVPCPLCGQDDPALLLRQRAGADEGVDAYRLLICRACGLGYLNPRPTRETIGYYYPADYKPYQNQGKVKHRFFSLARLLGRGDPHSYLPVKPPGRLLDFGCGSGAYLERMRGLGWDVIGIDISPHGVEAARRRGIPAYQGVLPHPAVPFASVDVLNFGAVLEHVHDPHQLIAAARATVKPGGLLVFSVPNLASWGFRFFGPAWWPLELPRHLLHFTPATIRKLVKKHDLELLALKQPPHSNWMRLSLERSRGFRQQYSWRARLLMQAMRLRPLASFVTRYTARLGQGDGMLIIARRPHAEEAILRSAA